MEKFLCPICHEEVSVEDGFRDNDWNAILPSCEDFLARCSCGAIVENYSIVPHKQVMADCNSCGRQTHQEPFEFEKAFFGSLPQLPSLEINKPWLFVERQHLSSYPKATEKSGKWLIFVKRNRTDEIWKTIYDAVRSGELGCSAKISTNSKSSIRQNPNEQVICVYTYDWTDKEDVMRIRQKLKELGITWKIPYKADEDTSQLKYAKRGHTKISKYYE